MATDLSMQSIRAEQLAAMPNDKDFELVDGRLVERKMGNRSAWVALELAHHLRTYVRQHRLGWVFGAEAGYRLDPLRSSHVRKPDVSFVRFGRLPNERPAESYDNLAPDLAAEVLSPGDTALELDEKIEEYLQAGVRLVWVINPDLRTLTLFRPDQTQKLLRGGDEIDGEGVVPGFRLPLAVLFDMPTP